MEFRYKATATHTENMDDGSIKKITVESEVVYTAPDSMDTRDAGKHFTDIIITTTDCSEDGDELQLK